MAELQINRCRRIKTGDKTVITFEIPAGYIDAVWAMVQSEHEKNEHPFWRLKLAPWRKRRSTGKGSQCNHFHGHCQTIATETGNDFDDIKMMIKWKAAREMGYPLVPTEWTDENGQVHHEEAPMSEAEANTVESGILIECCHVFAAFEEIALIEEESW